MLQSDRWTCERFNDNSCTHYLSNFQFLMNENSGINWERAWKCFFKKSIVWCNINYYTPVHHLLYGNRENAFLSRVSPMPERTASYSLLSVSLSITAHTTLSLRILLSTDHRPCAPVPQYLRRSGLADRERPPYHQPVPVTSVVRLDAWCGNSCFLLIALLRLALLPSIHFSNVSPLRQSPAWQFLSFLARTNSYPHAW